MLHIQTYLKSSTIHGIGLFAAEDIKEGQLVWRMSPIDVKISNYILGELPILHQESIAKYGFINPDNPNVTILCSDDAKFLNFGGPPNLKLGEPFEGEYDLLAAHDIKRGEEITVGPETDADYARKLACS